MPARSFRSLLVLTLSAALVPAVAGPAAAAIPAPITVNSLGGPVADDGVCTLPEAITAANTNAPSGGTAGECTGGADPDNIIFSVAGTVELTGSMPAITSSVTIDGLGEITIDGNGHGSILKAGAGTVVVIRNLTVTGAAGEPYGAVRNDGANLTLSHVTVAGNAADNGGAGVGTLTGGTTRILDSVITGNASGISGAGVFQAAGGSTTVERSTISDNTAAVGGGGIVAAYGNGIGSGTVTLWRSTLSGNSAPTGGGAWVSGVLTLRNSTVAENAAATMGGGVAVTGTDLGGGAMAQGRVNIIASTIALNTSHAGAGVLVMPGGTWALVNALLIGNADGGDWVGDDLDGAVNSLVGIPENHTLDEYLDGGLADNGGPTETIRLARTPGNLALGRGKSTVCSSPSVSGVDQRGVARPTLCDVGAFELENVDPTTSVPTQWYLRTQLGAGGVTPVRIAWSGSDGSKGSGIRSYAVSRSINGGAWKTVSYVQAASAYDLVVTPGTTYRFRVRATDRDGNTGTWKLGPSFTARLVQQTSTAIRYAGTWARSESPGFAGGSARTSSTAGSSATFTFTGRAVALVTTVGPDRGRARVYVNGTYITTIDLASATKTDKVEAWSRSWSTAATRTVKVVVLGTPGRPRVDIDAFLVLR